MANVPDYPSNSKSEKPTVMKKEAPKEAAPKAEVIATGGVKQRKPPLSKRFASTFASEDAGSVGKFILNDVAIPALKSLLSDMASQGVERLLFGDSRPNRHRSGGGGTSYNAMYRGPSSSSGSRQISSRARSTHDFDEIVLETRGDAEAVLDQLSFRVAEYGQASVSDLYDMVGITGSFVDDKWGWTDIRGAHVQRVRDGYLLNLPRTHPLD